MSYLDVTAMILEQNFQNYLKVKNKNRKISLRTKKKLKKILNLQCKNHLKHGPKILLNETNWNLKLHNDAGYFYDIKENLINSQTMLCMFDENKLPYNTKSNNNSVNEELTISQTVCREFENESTHTDSVSEIQKENINLQNGLRNSDNQYLAENLKAQEHEDPSAEEMYNEVQDEFKIAQNKNTTDTNNLKNEENLSRNCRKRTPAIYDENLTHIEFCNYPRDAKPRRSNSSSNSRKRLNSTTTPPNGILKVENTVSTNVHIGQYLQIKKLRKNTSSFVELIIPKSITNTLMIQPLQIKIDLKCLDLNQLQLEQNRQEQELANIQETARATAVLTGDYVPPKSKQNSLQPKRKRKPKQDLKQKRPIAEYLEQFSSNDDALVQSSQSIHNENMNSQADELISQIILTQTSSGWVTTGLGANCVIADNNIVSINDDKQFSDGNNLVLHTIPTFDLTLNDSFSNTVSSTSNINNDVLQNIQVDSLINNQYELTNFRPPENSTNSILKNTKNIQTNPNQKITKNNQPNINTCDEGILDLSTKRLNKGEIARKVKTNYTLEYIPLGYPFEKSKPKLDKNIKRITPSEYRARNTAKSLEKSIVSCGLDMPTLDLDIDFSNSDYNGNATMQKETNDLFDCILSNTLNNSTKVSTETSTLNELSGTSINTIEENFNGVNVTIQNEEINYLSNPCISVNDNTIIYNYNNILREVSTANNEKIIDKNVSIEKNTNLDHLCLPDKSLEEEVSTANNEKIIDKPESIEKNTNLDHLCLPDKSLEKVSDSNNEKTIAKPASIEKNTNSDHLCLLDKSLEQVFDSNNEKTSDKHVASNTNTNLDEFCLLYKSLEPEVSDANNGKTVHKHITIHKNKNSDEPSFIDKSLKQVNNTAETSEPYLCLKVSNAEITDKGSINTGVFDNSGTNCILNISSTSNKDTKTDKIEEFTDMNFTDFRNDELDFEDDVLSICADTDIFLSDEVHSCPPTPQLNNSNVIENINQKNNSNVIENNNQNNNSNVIENINQKNVFDLPDEGSSSCIFNDNFVDTDIFGIPRKKQENTFIIPKKNNQPSCSSSSQLHQSVLSQDSLENPIALPNRRLSIQQSRAPMCWPNNPTNIIKHPDQLRCARENRLSIDQKRGYHNNISASKLFGSPCFKYLDFGICPDEPCRFPHILLKPEVLKYQLINNADSRGMINLAYLFMKGKPKLFQHYAQTFIEIYAEEKNGDALLGMILDCEKYEYRYGWWKSIWVALIKMNMEKSDALDLLLKKIPLNNCNNIDFAIDLIIETDIIKFLRYIEMYSEVSNYMFRTESINKMASIYFQTKSRELQIILMPILCKYFQEFPNEKSQLSHPDVIHFLKVSTEAREVTQENSSQQNVCFNL